MHGNYASVRVLEGNGYEFVMEEFGTEDFPYGNGMLISKKTLNFCLSSGGIRGWEFSKEHFAELKKFVRAFDIWIEV